MFIWRSEFDEKEEQIKELKSLTEQQSQELQEQSEQIQELNSKYNNLNRTYRLLNVDKIKSEIKQLKIERSGILSHIVEDRMTIHYQDYGFYNNESTFDIKNELARNIEMQKEIIKQSKVNYNEFFHLFRCEDRTVKSIVTNYNKILIGNFVRDCDKFIDNLTIGNLSTVLSNIHKVYNNMNKLGEVLGIKVNNDLLDLKIEQCKLNYNLIIATNNEKEEDRIHKEMVKDQLKAEKELENERKKLDIELAKKLRNNASQLEIEILQDKIAENEYKSKLPKAGWVYVLSNNDMKSCGNKKHLKIGITRREVEKRISELSDASHSFKMNLHGAVFVEDCFALESALHRYFEPQRINRNKRHREWFLLDLEEVEKAIKELSGIDIKLKECDDEDYIYSKEYNNEIL